MFELKILDVSQPNACRSFNVSGQKSFIFYVTNVALTAQKDKSNSDSRNKDTHKKARQRMEIANSRLSMHMKYPFSGK